MTASYRGLIRCLWSLFHAEVSVSMQCPRLNDRLSPLSTFVGSFDLHVIIESSPDTYGLARVWVAVKRDHSLLPSRRCGTLSFARRDAATF